MLPFTVIPAKRSASRNPGRFAGYDLNFQQEPSGFPPRLSRLTIRRDDIRPGDVLSRE
jgi:hypothetical protein